MPKQTKDAFSLIVDVEIAKDPYTVHDFENLINLFNDMHNGEINARIKSITKNKTNGSLTEENHP